LSHNLLWRAINAVTGIANIATATMKTIAAITEIRAIGMTLIPIVATPETMTAIMNPAATGIMTGGIIIMTGMDAGLNVGIIGAIITETGSDPARLAPPYAYQP
jgi:hypothetical protein